MSYTQLTEKLEIVKDRDTIFVKVGADKIRLPRRSFYEGGSEHFL